MPFLRRKLDGGYFIRTHTSGFNTLQVSEEGVAFLKCHGIGENKEVPQRLLRQLLDIKFAFTTNTGIREEPLPSALLPASPIGDGLPIAIEENEHGWSLSILFPELHLEWVKETVSGPHATVIQECGFRLDSINHSTLSATRLWPGKGGAACFVKPHKQPYTVEPIGPWPSSWDLHDWIQDVRGLEPMGTLFMGDEEGGVRLRAGKSITPGTSYYLVVQANALSFLTKKQILSIPSTVQPHLLGQNDEWEAWVIHIPSKVDDLTREWCTRINHPLEKPLWRLELVSPPPLRYSTSRIPIVEVGTEAIIAAFPPSTALEATNSIELIIECDDPQTSNTSIHMKTSLEDNIGQERPIYLALPLHVVGTYRVRSMVDRVAPFTFTTVSAEFETEVDAITEQPAPLKVSVANTPSHVYLHAFDTSHHKTNLPRMSKGSLPDIEVDCLSPVNIYWSCGELRGQRQVLAPTDVTIYLAEQLHLMATNTHMFVLHIDAGNFGTLRLHFLPLIEESPGMSTRTSSWTAADTLIIAQRARWLSVAVVAFTRHGVPTMTLPRNLHTSLAQLEDLPGGASLAQLTRIPCVLLPYLNMLAQLLDTPNYKQISSLKNHSSYQEQQPLDMITQEKRSHMQSEEVFYD